MALTAQTARQKAGIGLTKDKFTTDGAVDVYLLPDGELHKGQGPGDPNGDLELDSVSPYEAGSIWINTTDGLHYRKTDANSKSWVNTEA